MTDMLLVLNIMWYDHEERFKKVGWIICWVITLVSTVLVFTPLPIPHVALFHMIGLGGVGILTGALAWFCENAPNEALLDTTNQKQTIKKWFAFRDDNHKLKGRYVIIVFIGVVVSVCFSWTTLSTSHDIWYVISVLIGYMALIVMAIWLHDWQTDIGKRLSSAWRRIHKK